MKEPRSHIEGATPSTAIWSFGIVPDPFTPPGRQPRLLNRRIPVDDFLQPGHDRMAARPRLRPRRADRNRQTGQGTAQRAGVQGGRARRGHRSQPGRAGPGPLGVRQPDQTRRRPQGAGGRRPKPPAIPTKAEHAQERGRRAVLAADHRRDDLQRLSDHQGESRRAGLRRDPGDQPPHRPGVRGGRLSDQGILHQPRAASRLDPGRLGRRAADRDPLPEPHPVPGDGGERPLSPGTVGKFRLQLHEGALRRLAAGHGLDRDRRLRRHVPELAGGPA